jgi:hypothetical protein
MTTRSRASVGEDFCVIAGPPHGDHLLLSLRGGGLFLPRSVSEMSGGPVRGVKRQCAPRQTAPLVIYGAGGLGDRRGPTMEGEAHRTDVDARSGIGVRGTGDEVRPNSVIAWLDRCTGCRRDKEDHIVVVRVVVEPRNPGRIGRARKRRRCQGGEWREQHCGDQLQEKASRSNLAHSNTLTSNDRDAIGL